MIISTHSVYFFFCYWGPIFSLWHWNDYDCLKPSTGMNSVSVKTLKAVHFCTASLKAEESKPKPLINLPTAHWYWLFLPKSSPEDPFLSLFHHSFTSIYLSLNHIYPSIFWITVTPKSCRNWTSDRFKQQQHSLRSSSRGFNKLCQIGTLLFAKYIKGNV